MHHGFQNSDKVYSWEDLLESREQIKQKTKNQKNRNSIQKLCMCNDKVLIFACFQLVKRKKYKSKKKIP